MAQNALRKPVLIVGSGISGLSLAQGLCRAQIPFHVFEKDEAFESRSQGYRFGLDPFGVEALQANLDPEHFERFKRTCSIVPTSGPPALLDAVTGRAGEVDFAKQMSQKMKVLDKDGKLVKREEARKKTPPSKVDRRTLREVLIQGVEDRVQFGKAFRSYAENDEGVEVTFADGTSVSGSILIGADGGWSRIRQTMRPDYTLRNCGNVPLLGKTPLTPELEKTISGDVLKGFALLQTPTFSAMVETMKFNHDLKETPDDYIFWVLFLKREHYPSEESILAAQKSSDGALAVAKAVTKEWHPSLRCLFEQPNTGSSQLPSFTGTPDQLAPNPTATSRVTLVGDAAHLMAPTGGSGALTALRDAALLAKKLTQEGVTPEVLRSYEKEMIEYAEPAYQQTLQGGRIIFGFKDYEEMPVVRL